MPCDDLSTHDAVLALYRADMKEVPHEPKRLLTGEEIIEITGLPSGGKMGEEPWG